MTMSVFVNPGSTAFTVMPFGDSSKAMRLVSVSTAPLVTAYSVVPAIAVPMAALEARFTIRPQPRRIISGATASEQYMTPLTLVRHIPSNSSSL